MSEGGGMEHGWWVEEIFFLCFLGGRGKAVWGVFGWIDGWMDGMGRESGGEGQKRVVGGGFGATFWLGSTVSESRYERARWFNKRRCLFT